MELKYVLIILKKELKDFLRDRKTIIISVVIPIILIPVLFALIGNQAKDFDKKLNENIKISLSKESNTKEIKDFFEKQIINDNKNIEIIDSNNPVDDVRNEKIRLAVEVDKDFEEKIKSKKPVSVKMMYDESKEKSVKTMPIIQGLVDKFNKSTVEKRLTEIGENPEILEPVKVAQENVKDKEKMGNSLLASLIPLFIVIGLASGGVAAATDLVAGERERNTLEPLLTTKPGRLSILIGKYLAVTTLSFISVAAMCVGYIIAIGNSGGILQGSGGGNFTGINIGAAILVLVVILLLGLIYSGIQIALSTYAKSFKEAQTYLSFVVIFSMLPAYGTMFVQISDSSWYMFLIPVLSAILSLKMILSGSINYLSLIVAISSSIVFVGLVLGFVVRMFNNEKVLFRN